MLRYLLLITGLILSASIPAAINQNCVMEQLSLASNEMTVGEIKKLCHESETTIATIDSSAISKRLDQEKSTEDLPFVIAPHKPNYLIIGHNFSSPNSSTFAHQFPNENVQFDDQELKFQISLKFPVWNNIFGDNGDLYLAYTNRSFWQAFNKDLSSPFRDSNHEPEAWLQFDNDWRIFGFTNRVINVGAVHQSNGRAGELSRSWNRLFATFVFEHENTYFYIKPWYRIPESENVDNNPDITHYMGNFEFQGIYKYNKHSFGLMARNNFESDNKGALQLDWTFPISDKLKGYVQWFNGYGESLIDYNHHVNSIGIGVKLTDWL